MGDDGRVIKANVKVASTAGPLWLAGWLFTIGFAQLVGWKILWALFIWPYYLGVAMR